MLITNIIASAQAGFNHPFEQYANFKPSITLEAIIEDGDNAELCAKALQAKAQDLVDAERVRIEAECQHENDVGNAEQEVSRWGSVVASFENTMATVPTWLAENDGVVSSDGVAACARWEVDDKKRALAEAEANIAEARTKLAEAKAKLAALIG